MGNNFEPIFDPVADPDAIVLSGNLRVSILKSRLLRIEYSPECIFEDRPSQVFWYRKQDVPDYSINEENGWLTIETNDLKLNYHIGEPLTYRHLNIIVKTNGSIWYMDTPDHNNLGGTYRTLDSVDGRVHLGQGLVSQTGWSLIDDTNSLVFADGWLKPRSAHSQYRDYYFFGYGHNYLDAIKEYQLIAGRPQLLPRWALGNWWSRYWAYSQHELLALMDEFEQHNIPLSVCIVDMDWHITETGNSSSGWTGYTWNRRLFPEPEEFLNAIHSRRLKTALNLHPAEGIHPHEEKYQAFAKTIGADPESKAPIPFEISSKEFTNAYFHILHHPLEDIGVDFWWIDWQQGCKTKTEGLDPLYWLNHLHYYDLTRNGKKRPFIFSRWPGLGGHRYPIGFSGDTIVSWNSLAFQPEFTATAANVAYGWWSHDIGGHTDGIEEAELYVRWVQFGVFSPILRLHSTNNPYIERRPWGYGLDTLEIVRAAMQLRHQLIPLLYTSNWINATTGEPIILPMYYEWSEDPESYIIPDQYTFCRQMIAAPFTSKLNTDTQLARQIVWLPDGDWFNFFSGEYYEGGGWYAYYGSTKDIPIFCKSGAIIPLNDDSLENSVSIPKTMKLKIFPGIDSDFLLYEDDGESPMYHTGDCVTTNISQSFSNDTLTIKIQEAHGSYQGMLKQRNWKLEIYGVTEPDSIESNRNGRSMEYEYDPTNHTISVNLNDCDVEFELVIKLIKLSFCRESLNTINKIMDLIKEARLPTRTKQMFVSHLPEYYADPTRMEEMRNYFTPSQLLSIYETFVGKQPNPILKDIDSAIYEMRIALSRMGF